METNLANFNNDWFNPGNRLKRLCWYFVNLFFFKTGLFPFSGLKVLILKSFGAQIGNNVNIKPSVNIKYAWNLKIGNNTWIGENVWIDNLVTIYIGSNVCISQGAFLLTGNHNYKKETFDLIVKEIRLEDGVWIGAKCTVCPGVICKSHSILTVQSTATKDMEPYSIYQGNPAVFIRKRTFENEGK